MFKGSSASGAERAYRRAVEKLTILLVEAGVLHAVRLKRKSIKKFFQFISSNAGELDCSVVLPTGGGENHKKIL